MKKSLFAGLTAGLLLVGMVGVASATSINVDFGFANQNIYSGAGAAATTGTIWNGLDFTGGTNLSDSTGSVTSVSVTTTASQAYRDTAVTNALLSDRIFVTNTWTQFSFFIDGLNDSSTYDLYLYGSNTRYASTYTESQSTISDYALGDQSDTLVHNINYALLTQLISSNGSIAIDVDRYSGSAAAVIGGFQLVETAAPVPEPSTILLLGSGLLGLGWYGRKQKKS